MDITGTIASFFLDNNKISGENDPENIIIAACLAKGVTKLRNCSLEPEVQDLINFLNKLGCKINKVGTRSIDVYGVKNLGSATHKVIFDRIVTGSYIIAAALTNGRLKIIISWWLVL